MIPSLLDPAAAAPLLPSLDQITYRWAVVVGNTPLQIQLDGDDTPLTIVPDSLIGLPPVAGRVYVQLFNRRALILGIGGVDLLASYNTLLANYNALAAQVNAIELGTSGTDLDTLLEHGIYSQNASANAVLALNYPPITAAGAYAGTLEVFANPDGNVKFQRYMAYRTVGLSPYPSVWYRSFVAGGWSPWVAVQNDTGDISTVSSIAVAQSGWTISSGHLRQINKMVTVNLFLVYTGTTYTPPATGDVTNDGVCQMLAAYRPLVGYSQGGFSTTSSGRAATFYMDTDGILTLSAVAGSADVQNGHSFSVGGQYLMN